MDGVSTAGVMLTDPEDSQAPSADERGPAAGASPEIAPERVIEAILFASDSPLQPAKIASILGVGDARDVREHIASLNAQYEQVGLSFRIEEIAGGYRLLTLPDYNPWLIKLLRTREDARLSPAALETLAIVAYKQPATRADIEAIRGVAAGDMLNRLREANLVKIVGRADDLGRPLLYGTTKHFLEVFGLASLEDLPQVEALRPAAAAKPSSATSAIDRAVTELEAVAATNADMSDSPAAQSDHEGSSHLTLVRGDDDLIDATSDSGSDELSKQ